MCLPCLAMNTLPCLPCCLTAPSVSFCPDPLCLLAHTHPYYLPHIVHMPMPVPCALSPPPCICLPTFLLLAAILPFTTPLALRALSLPAHARQIPALLPLQILASPHLDPTPPCLQVPHHQPVLPPYYPTLDLVPCACHGSAAIPCYRCWLIGTTPYLTITTHNIWLALRALHCACGGS